MTRDYATDEEAKERREVHRGALRALWKRRGKLYSASFDALFAERLRSALAEEICPERVPEPPNGIQYEVAQAWPRIVYPREQRIASLYPICSLDKTSRWRCEHCKGAFFAGLGCVECLAFVCPRCVRAEQHVHDDRDFYLLGEVGRAMGVGPERVRQMEAKTLRKLRSRPYRAVLQQIDTGITPAERKRLDAENDVRRARAKEDRRAEAKRKSDAVARVCTALGYERTHPLIEALMRLDEAPRAT